MTLVPDDETRTVVSYMVAGALVVLIGAAMEVVGRALFPPLRLPGMVVGLFGVFVFFAAGVWHLSRYISQFLP